MRKFSWALSAIAVFASMFLPGAIRLASSQTAPPTPTITAPANGVTVSSPVTVMWSGSASPYIYTLWRNGTKIPGCIDLSYTSNQCPDSGASGSVTYNVGACSGLNNAPPCVGSNSVSVTVGSGSSSTPPPSPSPTTSPPPPSPSPAPVPAAPTVSIPSSSAMPVNISWNSVSTTTVWYNLSRRAPPGSANAWVAVANSLSGISYQDSNVSPGTSYEYRVNACNSSGCSADSNYASVSVASSSGGGGTSSSTPAAPSGLNFSISGSSVNLTWTNNSANETRFEIYRQASGTWSYFAQASAGVTSFSDQNVPAGTYYYQVAACNGMTVNTGCSAGSNISGPVALGGLTSPSPAPTPPPASSTIPAAPSNLTYGLSNGGTTVALNWQDNSNNETRFEIYREQPGGSWMYWNQVNAGVISYSDSNVAAGTYYYQVAACNGSTTSAGCSSGSNIVAVTIGAAGATSTSPAASSTSPAPTPSAAAPGFLQGAVRDAAGQPVSGAYVHVFTSDFSLNFSAIAQSDGSFGVSLPAGTFNVEISPPSSRTDLINPGSQSVTIASGATQTIRFQFNAVSKTIVGSASFSSGQPVTDAQVGAYSNATGQWVSGVTDGNGSFTLKVGPGIWQVGIRPLNPGSAQWTSPTQFPQVIFANDSSAETQKVNFVIPFSGAQITVHTVDDNGAIVQSAGVVVDSLSASQTASAGAVLVPPAYRKSDANGLALFSLQGGTYYLRASLPPESGYFNPSEQQLSLNAKDIKDVSLVFHKRAITAATMIQGTTKLEDGTLADASIWAWSEKGDAAQARADANGVFSFSATSGRWHVNAGKLLNGFPYKSSELTVDVGISPASVDIVLSRGGTALPPPVSVSQPSTQQIIAQATDGATVQLPENAAATSGDVDVAVKPTIEAPSGASQKVVSTVYDVSLTNASGTAITSLQKEIEITIPYSDADLRAQGTTADKIVPSYYDETTGTWVKVDSYVIDKDNHQVVMRVKHLTRFALIAAADITPPAAPTEVAAKASGAGEILITWTNPASDFDHAKVYRSTVAGDLGKILANNVSDTQTKDTNVIEGTKYYYTVAAVDPAGNESPNNTQVLVVAQGTSLGAGGKLSRNLKVGSRGDDVKTLQGILVKEGVYPEGIVSGYFGRLTAQAVARFQEKYADEILKPNGLDYGTGFVGSATRAKVNLLLQ